MKLIVVSVFYLFFINFSLSQEQSNAVQQAINHFKTHQSLENAAISFLAYDIDTDEIIAEYNHKTAIMPASTVKLFTTATAFEV